MKICNKCGIEKSPDKFIKNKHCKNGITGVCKECSNKYQRIWKRKNKIKLKKQREERYAKTGKLEVLRRRDERRKLYPLRCRAQVLRNGMRNRAHEKNLDFDSDFFTVAYLMDRLLKNPNCECCRKKLDINFKKDKKFNQNSPSMDRVDNNKGYIKGNVAILCWRCNRIKQDANPSELRSIADFMEQWIRIGYEIDGKDISESLKEIIARRR